MKIAEDTTKTYTLMNESKQDAFPQTNYCTKSSQMLLFGETVPFGTFPVGQQVKTLQLSASDHFSLVSYH